MAEKGEKGCFPSESERDLASVFNLLSVKKQKIQKLFQKRLRIVYIQFLMLITVCTLPHDGTFLLYHIIISISFSTHKPLD